MFAEQLATALDRLERQAGVTCATGTANVA
jgi:hypothetical protein